MKYDDLRNMTEAERLETYRGMQNAHETFIWYDAPNKAKLIEKIERDKLRIKALCLSIIIGGVLIWAVM